MHDRISERQLRALLFCAATAPAFWLCAGMGWLWVLLGGCGAAGVLTILYKYVPVPSERLRGRGRPAAGVLLSGLLALSAWAALRSTCAFPELAEHPLAAGLLLLLAAWGAEGGAAAAGRCAGILLWVLLLLYGTVLLFSLPQLRPEALIPGGDPEEGLFCFAALLLPGAGLLLRRETVPRWGNEALPFFGAALLAAAGAAVTAGTLTPALATEEGSFLRLAKSVSILGVIQRFEAVISGALLISGFCLCGLLLNGVRALLSQLRSEAGGRRMFRLLLLPAAAALWVPAPVLGRIGALTATCGGAAWIILQGVEQRKNFGKNEKKC